MSDDADSGEKGKPSPVLKIPKPPPKGAKKPRAKTKPYSPAIAPGIPKALRKQPKTSYTARSEEKKSSKKPAPAPAPEAETRPDEGEDDELDAVRLSEPPGALPVMEPEEIVRRTYVPLAQFGRFELLGQLEIGGMANLYLARESAEHGASRHVVIKVVRGEMAEQGRFADMFLDEGRMMMRLTHPNICTVYECGREAGRFFLALEFIEGETLRHMIVRAAKRKEKLPLAIVIKLFAQVAEALDFAHLAKDAEQRALNIVHRDISPANIMVRYDGVAKLLDFGVAKAERGHHETMDGAVKGKLSYFSPEQAKNEKLDGRSDLFSLAICMFEALTGRRLYHHKTQYDTLAAILTRPTPKISGFRDDAPPELDRIMMKALEKDAEKRYQRGADLQHDLEQLLSEMREVVGTKRIGELMQDLFDAEIRRGPVLETEVIAERFPSLVFETSGGDASEEDASEQPSPNPLVLGAAAAALAIFVGVIAVNAGSGENADTTLAGSAPATVSTPLGPPDDEPTETGDEIPEGVDSPGETADAGVAEQAPEEAEDAGISEEEAAAELAQRFEELREQARAHFRARRYGPAARKYEEAIELRPDHAGSYAGLGAARTALRQHHRAVRAYAQAVELSSETAGFHAALGNAYRSSGEDAQARQAYETALRLNPDNRTARAGLDALGD